MTGKGRTPRFTEEQDEVLESIWRVLEGGPCTEDAVVAIAPVRDPQARLAELAAAAVIARRDGTIAWLPDGEMRARELIRRHRLMEILLAKVFGISRAGADRMACDIEHILDSEATDSLCAFLGHPALCPEGHPIPPGPCCAGGDRALRTPIRAASEVPAGTRGRILYLRSRNPGRLDTLSSLGIVPGSEVVIHQIRPALVLRVGETDIALDPAVASDIVLALP